MTAVATTLRRLAILTAATLAVCALTWVMVDTAASRPVRNRRERSWTKPDWPGMGTQMLGQLLVVAVAAVVGRKVLRFRL